VRFLQAIGVMALLDAAHGAAGHRAMIPFVQYVLRYGVKTLCGIASIHALPRWLCRDEARMRLVGFKAQQGRQGRCQRGATQRQGERLLGPIGPDPLAKNMVQWHLRDLEAVCNGAMRALATAGVCGAKVTGLADGTDLETTEREAGWGQVTRQVRMEDTRGKGHAIEGTIDGGQGRLLSDAVTKRPWAVTVGPMQAHEARWPRALVTQARLHLQGDARRHQVSFDTGFWDGTMLWWLDQHARTGVVPAKAEMAVTADARAQAAAGEDRTVGRRVHTVRHGHGQRAWRARLETEVVGITDLTTADQSGTPEHARHANRRDFQANPIHAVVVRKWQGQDDGPGGNTVFLTKAPVAQPLRPFDDDDDRRLMENCGSKEAKPPWALGHPPQQPARAVRVPVVFTLLLVALATAYQRPCQRAATAGEAVGWQRWRRQLLEQTRDQVLVCAQGHYGILHLAEYSRLWGVKRKDVPPDIGSRHQVLATCGILERS
jgi:hypothetical protein